MPTYLPLEALRVKTIPSHSRRLGCFLWRYPHEQLRASGGPGTTAAGREGVWRVRYEGEGVEQFPDEGRDGEDVLVGAGGGGGVGHSELSLINGDQQFVSFCGFLLVVCAKRNYLIVSMTIWFLAGLLSKI